MEQPPIPTREKEKSTLTFEEFSAPDGGGGSLPRYNNFFCYFIAPDSLFGDIKKAEKPYVDLVKSHPDLVKKISDNICDESISRGERLDLATEDMYEAYRIMREGGAMDEELFR